jgi:hypothetical protein
MSQLTDDQAKRLTEDYQRLVTLAQQQLNEHKAWLKGKLSELIAGDAPHVIGDEVPFTDDPAVEFCGNQVIIQHSGESDQAFLERVAATERPLCANCKAAGLDLGCGEPVKAASKRRFAIPLRDDLVPILQQVDDIKLELVRPEAAVTQEVEIGDTKVTRPTLTVVYGYPDELFRFLQATDTPQELRDSLRDANTNMLDAQSITVRREPQE